MFDTVLDAASPFVLTIADFLHLELQDFWCPRPLFPACCFSPRKLMTFLPSPSVMNLKSQFLTNYSDYKLHRRNLLDLGVLSLGYTHSLLDTIVAFVDTVTPHD